MLLISKPEILYHVTYKNYLKSILKNGLKAHRSIDGNPIEYIYTFVSLDNAISYLGQSKNRVILKLDINNIPERVMSHHDMGLLDASEIIRLHCDLKPERIKVIK